MRTFAFTADDLKIIRGTKIHAVTALAEGERGYVLSSRWRTVCGCFCYELHENETEPEDILITTQNRNPRVCKLCLRELNKQGIEFICIADDSTKKSPKKTTGINPIQKGNVIQFPIRKAV